MAKPKVSKNILWVDLEMTGIDPEKDRILEVAAIITDWDFNELGTYESAVRVSPSLVKKRMKAGSDFWDKFEEVKNSLIKQNNEAELRPKDVEDELLAFISADFDDDQRILLAGNSIHQDRKFIDREWPRLAAKLHYRMLDVSAWKVVFEGKYRRKYSKPENHRAMDDIRGSIEELRYYLNKVEK